nr:MAG TPA: hypothetical protein [Myoviridae sp. ctLGX4]
MALIFLYNKLQNATFPPSYRVQGKISKNLIKT